MIDLEKMKNILTDKGFKEYDTAEDAELSNKYEVAMDILKNIKNGENRYWLRKIRWHNEWHDEKLTQLQIVIVRDKIGLGTLVQLANDLLSSYLNKEVSLELKTEYIRNVVPGIEFLLEGKGIAGGGFIENKDLGHQMIVLTLIGGGCRRNNNEIKL